MKRVACIIPVELRNDLVAYLGTLPFKDVNRLVFALERARVVEVNETPTAEATTPQETQPPQ